MRIPVVVLLIFLCLVGSVSATAFSSWAVYGDAWKATNDTTTLIMWNATGSHTWLATGNASFAGYLVVAGGGSSWTSGWPGGGGAGGVRAGSNTSVAGSVAITVGNGGTGNQQNGYDSAFGSITATGGGAGGYSNGDGGYNGGSGGGAGGMTGGTRSGGTGASGQGQSGGGAGAGTVAYGGAGGGGNSTAGGAGGDLPGNGGSGFTSFINGTSGVCYAGGGGGKSSIPTYGTATCGGGSNSAGVPATGGGGSGGFGGGSGIIVISYATPQPPVGASFTQSSNPSNPGQVVTYTDTSTGNPVTWNWTLIGTSLTNSTQNAAYTYTTTGTYNIFLNVTNTTGAWSNTSQTHTVVNASIFVPQDIWMTAQYAQTFHVTNSNTLAPIGNVTITSIHSGTAITDVSGTAAMTTVFGPETMSFAVAGYQPKSVAYVFDSDASHDVQLIPEAATPTPYLVKYPPKDVRFHVQTLSGLVLPLSYVTATPVQTTLGNYAYVASLFGYDFSEVPMSNLTLSGYSDSRGDITFAMMTDVQYSLTASKPGYTFRPLNITPHDDNYLIISDYTGSLFVANGTAPAASVTFQTIYTRVNQTVGLINISYVDTAGATTAGRLNITQTNKTIGGTSAILIAGGTFTGNSSWKNFTLIDAVVSGCAGKTSVVYDGNGAITSCLNQTLVDGASYQTSAVGYTSGGNVYETGTVWFIATKSPIAGLSPEFALFIALGIMMFTAMMAGTSTAPAVSLVVTFEGWVFYGMNMFVLMAGPMGSSGRDPVLDVLTIMTIITIIWLFVTFRRSGK